MIRLLTRLSGVCLILTATACSFIPERIPADFYPLTAQDFPRASTASVLHGLRISTPITSDALGGNRLLVQVDDGSLQALAGARWDTQVPQLWRDFLLDAFRQDGRVSGLSAGSEGLQARRELGGTLRAFQGEFINNQSEVLIRFDARLVDPQSRTILASQRFEVREPARDQSAAATVQALSRAAQRLARELIGWTVSESASTAG